MRPHNVFIFGVPRSGTTWLGKLFDSHPNTFLRHEPDTVHPTETFPFAIPPSKIDQYLDEARSYLLERTADRELRVVAGKPYFMKNYRSPAVGTFRKTLLQVGRALDAIFQGKLDRKLRVPDLATKNREWVNVVKSVDSTARLPLFAKSCPDHAFIYIIRHPCGVVNSRIRGKNLGKLGNGKAFKDWLIFPHAIESGLTDKNLEGWSNLEIAAWGWSLINDSVLRSVHELSNIKVVDYDALCKEPIQQSKEIFDWTKLAWSEQTEEYVRACMATDPNQATGYYSTEQNPAVAADKWKTELSAADIDIIMNICLKSAACRQFLEHRW